MSGPELQAILTRLDELESHITKLFDKGDARDRQIAANREAVRAAQARWDAHVHWTQEEKDQVLTMLTSLPSTIKQTIKMENEEAALRADARRYRDLRRWGIAVIAGVITSGAVIAPALQWVFERLGA